MHRFFVKPEQILSDRVIIVGNDAHHITDVLRLSPGQRIIISDGEGFEYESEILSCTKNEVKLSIIKVRKSTTEPPIRVVLAQGMPKKAENLELVIQKATELGVSRFVPLISERTVVRPKEGKMDNRLSRWDRIAQEAAKQSQRAVVPVIDKPMSLKDFLETVSRDAFCIIPWEMEKDTGMKETLKWEQETRIVRTAVVLIGPEGGFSQEEIDEARRAGAIPVSLGPRILRTETAAITVLGIVMYELGDLGGNLDG